MKIQIVAKPHEPELFAFDAQLGETRIAGVVCTPARWSTPGMFDLSYTISGCDDILSAQIESTEAALRVWIEQQITAEVARQQHRLNHPIGLN